GGPVTLRVRSNAPSAFATTIFDGTNAVTADHHEQDFTFQASDIPAVYRVEIRPERSAWTAWLMSNPIYVRAPDEPASAAVRPPAAMHHALFDGNGVSRWRIEHDPRSTGAFDVSSAPSEPEFQVQYSLAGGPVAGQYVALVHELPDGTGSSDRVDFRVR